MNLIRLGEYLRRIKECESKVKKLNELITSGEKYTEFDKVLDYELFSSVGEYRVDIFELDAYIQHVIGKFESDKNIDYGNIDIRFKEKVENSIYGDEEVLVAEVICDYNHTKEVVESENEEKRKQISKLEAEILDLKNKIKDVVNDVL